jgi:hypothetical protein
LPAATLALLALATLVWASEHLTGQSAQAEPTIRGQRRELDTFEAAGIRPTSELDGEPTAASGTLSGHTEGAKVYLYAEPFLPDLPAGAYPFDKLFRPVGVAVPSGSRYRVVVDPRIDLRPFANEAGHVEFTAFGVSGEYAGSASFSRPLDADGKITPFRAETETVATEDGRLEPRPTTLDIDIVNRQRPVNRAGDVGPLEEETCIVQYPLRQVRIGAGFHRVGGVRLRLVYERGSTSSINVGVRWNGGEWGVSGSGTKENTRFARIAWHTMGTADKFHTTTYEFKHTRCGYWTPPNPGYWYWEQFKANKLAGGNQSSRPAWYPVTPRRYCRPFQPAGGGFEFEVDEGENVRFEKGVHIPFVNLGARSGYNESTKMQVDVFKHRYICGWRGYPADDPGLLVVGLPKS